MAQVRSAGLLGCIVQADEQVSFCRWYTEGLCPSKDEFSLFVGSFIFALNPVVLVGSGMLDHMDKFVNKRGSEFEKHTR